jgi:hypothetical protein
MGRDAIDMEQQRDEFVGNTSDAVQGVDRSEPEKNPAAVALGRLGGKKGGPARALRLSAERRSEIAQKAAQTRWRSKQSKREEG